MKSILRNLIALVIVLSSTATSFATEYPTISLSENKTLVVSLNDWTNTDVSVTIKQTYGSILYSDAFTKGSTVGQKYNLSNIPSGEYELIIEGQRKKAVQKITILNNDLIIRSNTTEIIFKPTLTILEDHIDFNQLALGRDISFMISDNTGVFFTKEYEGRTTINTKFDITSLPAGNYVAIVSGKNQYDTYEFSK